MQWQARVLGMGSQEWSATLSTVPQGEVDLPHHSNGVDTAGVPAPQDRGQKAMSVCVCAGAAE